MDYFSKFKKRMVAPKAPPTSAMQYAKFHQCWDYIHNIFIAEERKPNLHVDQTEIPAKLRQIVDLLVDEETRQEENTTGACMEFFLKHGLLQFLVNTAEKADYPEGIRGEEIRTIASMVDLLDDRFLVHNAVHRPTIKLLRFCVLDERQSEIDHEDLVDLMYIICSKIHGFPALLNIFFHDTQWLTTPQKMKNASLSSLAVAEQTSSSSSGKAAVVYDATTIESTTDNVLPQYEFLLFTYLLRFVHREGRSGDFARAGLLFLMEMAVDELGDFILESDFASIMAAGLGALYSQLPRKLIVKDDAQVNSSTANYLLGQDLDPRCFPVDEYGVQQSDSDSFKYQLDSFLKLLEFCQDTLLQCPNAAISERLLAFVRLIFLENILYPSILECSDTDGSAVAVASYLDLILKTIQQQDLSSVVVGYLMNASDDEDKEDVIMNKLMMMNSSTPTTGPEFSQFKNSPYFTAAERFTLKDLIFTRLKSTSQPTVIATLKLLKTLITKHCKFADRLLSTIPDTKTDQDAIVSHHIREVELYFGLITAIDGVHADDILTLGYEGYLKDIENALERDCCFQTCMAKVGYPKHNNRKLTHKEKRRSFKYEQRGYQKPVEKTHKEKATPVTTKTRQRIESNDTLIQILLDLLSHFFAQSSELNLALTGVISALATCPYRSLEGWICFSKSDRTNPNDILNLGSSSENNTSSTPAVTGSEIYHSLEEQPILDDDQSIDFGVEKNSFRMTTPTQFKSFPPFYTLYRTLTQQIDYYRSEVDGFDKLLDERWNGLLFGEPVANAPLLHHSSSASIVTLVNSNNSSSTVVTATAVTSTSAKQSSATPVSVVKQFFNRSSTNTLATTVSNNTVNNGIPFMLQKRRNSTASVLKPSTSMTNLSTATSIPLPNNPSKSLSSSTTAAAMHAMTNGGTSHSTFSHQASTQPPLSIINPLGPLARHAKRTLKVKIQPLFPSNFEIEREEPILDLDEEDQDMFAPPVIHTTPSHRKMDKSTEISLSMLLNNVVILEESIKELMAIVQVRKSLGVDRIRYTC